MMEEEELTYDVRWQAGWAWLAGAGWVPLADEEINCARLDRQMTANRITKNVKIDTTVVDCLPLR